MTDATDPEAIGKDGTPGGTKAATEIPDWLRNAPVCESALQERRRNTVSRVSQEGEAMGYDEEDGE